MDKFIRHLYDLIYLVKIQSRTSGNGREMERFFFKNKQIDVASNLYIVMQNWPIEFGKVQKRIYMRSDLHR